MKIGDTSFPPGPASGGSVTTNSITPAARNAAWQAKKKLLEAIAPKLGAKPEELDLTDSRVMVKGDPAKSMGFRKACSQIGGEAIAARAERQGDYAVPEDTPPGGKPRRGGGSGGLGGVQFAQVAVDTQTGVVKVEKVVAIHDCGRPINPMTTISQINGGIIQGLSYALYENRILDRNTGLMVNPNLEQYKIAGSKDMPEIDAVLIEEYWGRSSTDAAGIGEPATVPTAGAIANAIYNAIGVRIRHMPMTPAVILAALQSRPVAGRASSSLEGSITQ
jgi:xanthine dehydrogenase YagR molybdenum-binding subunit